MWDSPGHCGIRWDEPRKSLSQHETWRAAQFSPQKADQLAEPPRTSNSQPSNATERAPAPLATVFAVSLMLLR